MSVVRVVTDDGQLMNAPDRRSAVSPTSYRRWVSQKLQMFVLCTVPAAQRNQRYDRVLATLQFSAWAIRLDSGWLAADREWSTTWQSCGGAAVRYALARGWSRNGGEAQKRDVRGYFKCRRDRRRAAIRLGKLSVLRNREDSITVERKMLQQGCTTAVAVMGLWRSTM
ncbi:hypothetical protein BDW22DRAFT_1349250 [Trametopsis cervina]|nr:hypothetical protein BDW22DRAFT_1349250 [Trametopsis cervina]